MEEKLEALTKKYEGIIDEGYSKLSESISKIPNVYVRSFVRGSVVAPFLFNPMPYLDIYRMRKQKVCPINMKHYSLANILIRDSMFKTPRDSNITQIGGAVATLYGIFGALGVIPLFAFGTVLDGANFLEQKIRTLK